MSHETGVTAFPGDVENKTNQDVKQIRDETNTMDDFQYGDNSAGQAQEILAPFHADPALDSKMHLVNNVGACPRPPFL